MAVRLPILTKGTPGMNVDFDITGTGVTSGTTTEYSIELGTTIQFNDLSTNNPTEWLWDFGDGTTSRLQNPTKTYDVLSSGYTVSLLAGKDGSGDYTEKINYIEVKPGALPYIPPDPTAVFIAGSVTSYPGYGDTFYDLSGNNNHMTLYSPTFVNNNNYSSYFNFNGTINGRGFAPLTPFSFNTPITFATWVYVQEPNNTGNNGVFGADNGGGAFNTLTYNERNTGWMNGSNFFSRTFDFNVKETEPRWRFIVMTYSPSVIKLYRDGVYMGEGTVTPGGDMYNKIFMGVRVPNEGPFLGRISMLYFYKRVLTPLEIETIYQSTSQYYV